jgi:hypothetical protein
MTNREHWLKILSNDIEILAVSLITTNMIYDGDYAFDGEDEYWVDDYRLQYVSPSGQTYSDCSYDECVKDTVEWLMEDKQRDE